MTSFYKNFVALCAEKGYSESGAAKAIGLSNAAASGWKKGKIPSSTTQQKLALLFNIPVECLLAEPSDGIKKDTTVPGDALSPLEAELMQYVRALSEEQKRFLLAQMQLLKQQESPSADVQ